MVTNSPQNVVFQLKVPAVEEQKIEEENEEHLEMNLRVPFPRNDEQGNLRIE